MPQQSSKKKKRTPLFCPRLDGAQRSATPNATPTLNALRCAAFSFFKITNKPSHGQLQNVQEMDIFQPWKEQKCVLLLHQKLNECKKIEINSS